MQLGEFFFMITTKGVDAFNAATGAAQKQMQGLESSGRKAGTGVAGGAQMAAAAMSALGKSAQATAAQISTAFNAALPAAMKFSQSMAAGFGEAGEKAAASVNRIGEAAKKVGAGLSSAFTGAVGIIAGFATAGLAASAQGERLTFQMSLLSRQVGSLFIPVFEACINVIRKVTEMLQSLTGAQQKALGATIALAVGVKLLMSASGLGLIVGVVTTAVAVFQFFGDAISNAGTKAGILGSNFSLLGGVLRELWGLTKEFGSMVVSVFGGIGSAIAAVFTGIMNVAKTVFSMIGATVRSEMMTIGEYISIQLARVRQLIKEIRSALTTAQIFVTGKSAGIISNKPWEDGKDRQQLTPKSGGFESVTASFNRIQQSVMNSFDPATAAKEQAKRDADRDAKLDAIRDAIAGKPLAVGT